MDDVRRADADSCATSMVDGRRRHKSDQRVAQVGLLNHSKLSCVLTSGLSSLLLVSAHLGCARERARWLAADVAECLHRRRAFNPRRLRVVAKPDDLDELLFGRPDLLKVFVSSQMRGKRLEAERKAVVRAVEATKMATAWHWERDAKAGPYCAKGVCVGHASTSDGLVLILGARLTPITRAEYNAAKRAGVPRFIFLKDRSRRDDGARRFIAREQKQAITRNFANTSELRTQVTASLLHNAVQAVRRDIARRR
jgi:hypothetical protein